MTSKCIKQAKNGWGKYVTFDNKPVYYHYHHGTSRDILCMMKNWELYENGWLVDNSSGRHLFNYLCDIGSGSRPIALDYLI